MIEKVNHPQHYNEGDIECINAIESALGDKVEGFYQGNCIKYLWRSEYKGEVEDLKKCKWYLDRWINWLETRPVKQNNT